MRRRSEHRGEKGRKVVLWAVMLLTVGALLGPGCSSATPVPGTPTPEEREPFSARRESEDGAIVAWNGYITGYEPGGEAVFDIAIRNETDGAWHGRYCLNLLAGDSHQVVATLKQHSFTLEPGVGFSDAVGVTLPQGLDEGAYGLSLAVRRPAGPLVDLVPIQIGETEEERRPATEQDMNASLAACPPVEGVEVVVEQAKADLARRLGVSTAQIEAAGVEPTEFPDASLGVPEPGKSYAQVVTPGYIIELTVNGETYRYHASEDRVVAVTEEEGGPLSGRITIEGVTVNREQVVIRGTSTLPEGACLETELWIEGEPALWWPTDTCAPVQEGEWRLAVPLEEDQALQPRVQYMVRAYLPGGPNIVSTFPFDLEGPPTPSS